METDFRKMAEKIVDEYFKVKCNRTCLIEMIETALRKVHNDAVEECASFSEDCIANGVVVLSAGEVSSAIRRLKKEASRE